jgi:hypothetical protein
MIRSAPMRGVPSALALALSLALGFGLTACSKGPSASQCDELLEHMISLEADSAGGKAATPEQKKALEEQKSKMREHLVEDFTSYCREQLPASQVACALEARSLEQIADCDQR